MKGIFRRIAIASACAMLVGLAGCRSGMLVQLKQDSYQPEVAASDVSAYKGASVYFPYFTNSAANTSIWNYYSQDARAYYEAMPTLQTFLWDCFSKAFFRIGVAQAADATRAPELQIVLNSITDREARFEATLTRPGEEPFRKQFDVTMPAPGAQDPAPELELRAYRMIDAMFTTMVSDADFRKAFLRK